MVGAIGFVVAVTCSGARLHPGLVAIAALGLFALAGFGGQDGLGTVAIALVGLGFGEALLPGTAGAGTVSVSPMRCSMAFALAALALAQTPVPGGGRGLTTPVALLAVFLLDAALVVGGRYTRRVPVSHHRSDHLPDRLSAALGGRSGATAALLVAAQLLLALLALFCGRAVWPNWTSVVGTAAIVGVLAVVAHRAGLDPRPTRTLRKFVVVGLVVIAVALAAAAVPGALYGVDAYHEMQRGREHATKGLALARDGKANAAKAQFRAAGREFSAARSKLESPVMAATLAVPYVASNVRAARALSDIGVDLADAGTSVAAAADPEKLSVVDGRLPLDAVRALVPELQRGSDALDRALARLAAVRNDTNLAPPVRDAVDKVNVELTRARKEANNAAAAAVLAPSLFGGDGDRTYLLVMQNNAEARATGGFIGSYALLTAHDGKLSVGPVLRTSTWNDAMRAVPDPTMTAPIDYLLRYAQFQPATNLQNVNLSPDFPTVGGVVMSLAPQAGVGHVDGVFSVDPVGLAALLRLTGPVTIDSWPEAIDADNVVKVTLQDAYAAFADTPDRADFLGEVARAAVDRASTQNLGTPAELAKVLGAAAHEGHLILAFERPAEQRLAEQLGVGMQMDPVRSDAIAVTTSNAAANKIDYYLDRRIDYRIALQPALDRPVALASAVLTTELTNNAPDHGLPPIVIGPSDVQFFAGESRPYVSLYSPLTLGATTVDDKPAALDVGREVGRNVGSIFAVVPSATTTKIVTPLDGVLQLRGHWYELQIRHQPTLVADKVSVTVSVPEGWRIDKVERMSYSSDRQASAKLRLTRTTTLRVRIVPVRSALEPVGQAQGRRELTPSPNRRRGRDRCARWRSLEPRRPPPCSSGGSAFFFPARLASRASPMASSRALTLVPWRSAKRYQPACASSDR